MRTQHSGYWYSEANASSAPIWLTKYSLQWTNFMQKGYIYMYINDLQEYLVSESGGVTIGHIQMLLLLYADDVVVFAKSSSELQQEMDKLFNYCNKWKLKLNTTKSKVVVFRKGNVAPRQSWKFGNDDIEAVNSLSYLDVLFSSNGLFTQVQIKRIKPYSRYIRG